MSHLDEHGPVDSSRCWLAGRVFRCAWCHGATPVSGGLPYYTYVYIADAGAWAVMPAAPVSTGTDGICPARLTIVRAGMDGLKPAA